MTRLYVLTFEGKRATDARIPHAHESGFPMMFVLVVLAALSVIGVAWGIPVFPGPDPSIKIPMMEDYLAPAMQLADRAARTYKTVVHEESSPYPGYAIAWAVALLGGAAGWYLYRKWLPSRAGQPLPAWISTPSLWARHKFYVDELYDLLIIRPFTALSYVFYKVVDEGLIDSVAVRGTAWVLRRLGGWVRYTQTGDAQSYATVMAVASAGLHRRRPRLGAPMTSTLTTWLVTLVVFLPLLSAVLVSLLPQNEKRQIRAWTFLALLLNFALRWCSTRRSFPRRAEFQLE